MARDFTKYNVEGLGQNLNKRQLVLTIVKDFIEKNNPTFDLLKLTFPDKLQGNKNGVIIKDSDTYDPTRFNLREPIKIKNNISVVVSNQWGENITNFISVAESLGYIITSSHSDNNSSQSKKKNKKDSGLIFLRNFKLETPFPDNIEVIIINVSNKPELIYEDLGELIIIHYDVKNNAIVKHNNYDNEPYYEYLNVWEAGIPDTYDDLKLWMGEMMFSGELDSKNWSISNHGGYIYDKVNVSKDFEDAIITNFNEKNMYTFIDEILDII